MVIDMGEEDDTPIILGRPFLNATNAIIYVGSGQVHFQFSREKVCCYFNSYTTYEQPRRAILGGDVDHPNAKEINPQRKVGRKMKNLKKL